MCLKMLLVFCYYEEAFEGPYVNIHWLILTGNQLPKLPRSIGKLRRMKKFMLANNQLRSLPEEMVSMQDLSKSK